MTRRAPSTPYMQDKLCQHNFFDIRHIYVNMQHDFSELQHTLCRTVT